MSSRRRPWEFSIRPAVPLYWRCTPTDAVPFFKNPVSSQISTPAGWPNWAATKPRRSSRTASASHTAVRSSRCIACGSSCPACSASHQQFLRSTGDSSPATNSRAARRGSTRANRPATRHISSPNSSRQPAGLRCGQRPPHHHRASTQPCMITRWPRRSPPKRQRSRSDAAVLVTRLSGRALDLPIVAKHPARHSLVNLRCPNGRRLSARTRPLVIMPTLALARHAWLYDVEGFAGPGTRFCAGPRWSPWSLGDQSTDHPGCLTD